MCVFVVVTYWRRIRWLIPTSEPCHFCLNYLLCWTPVKYWNRHLNHHEVQMFWGGRFYKICNLKKQLQQSAKSFIDREICKTAHTYVFMQVEIFGGKTRFSRTEMPPLFCVLDQTKKGAVKVVTSGGGENNNYEMEEVVRRVCVQSRAGRGGWVRCWQPVCSGSSTGAPRSALPVQACPHSGVQELLLGVLSQVKLAPNPEV